MPTFMMEQLRNLPIGTLSNVVCVGTDWPLHRVLTVFIEHRVSALPVVDENGCLVDIYAKFDVIVSVTITIFPLYLVWLAYFRCSILLGHSHYVTLRLLRTSSLKSKPSLDKVRK